MACTCIPEEFGDYFAEEVEKIQAQIKELPAVLSDVWSDITSLTDAEVGKEALLAVGQGILAGPALDGIIDLVEQAVAKTSPGRNPQLGSALQQLRGVKTTQDALKSLAAIIFILHKDSIFHLLRGLALRITQTSVAKLALLSTLKAQLQLLERSIELFESSAPTTDELRALIAEAASEVLQARTEVLRMRSRANNKTTSKNPAVQRAIDHIDAALELLNPANVDAALLEGLGGAIALSTLADATGAGAASAMVVGAHAKSVRETLTQLDQNGRKLNALVFRFTGAVASYKAASFDNYQATLLSKVSGRLDRVYRSMQFVAQRGTAFDLATSSPEWLAELAVAKTLLAQMPDEVLQQAEFDATALASYDLAIARLDSMTSVYVNDGLDNTTNLVAAGARTVQIAEFALQRVQTSQVLDHVEWMINNSAASTLPDLDFIEAIDENGDTLLWFESYGELVSSSGFSGTARPSRITQSKVHALFLIEVMDGFLATASPGDALITALIEALRLLGMDRGSDLLSESGISDFMSAGPLSWTYAGAAAECIQTAMADALDKGQDRVFDELDTVLTKLLAKVAGLQRAMQRKSALSLDSLLGKLQLQLDEFDALKAKLEGLATGLDC